MVSLIIADQLRSIVRKSADDFVAIFAENSALLTKLCAGAVPILFSVKQVLHKDTIRLEPTTDDIQSCIEGLLDQLLISADGIPRVETQLFSNMGSSSSAVKPNTVFKPNQCVLVDFEATFPEYTKRIKEKLRDSLSVQLQEPQEYIQKFRRHSNLIEKSALTEIKEYLTQEDIPQDKLIMVKLIQTKF